MRTVCLLTMMTMAMGCGGEAVDTATEVALGACEGDGDGSVVLGSGGRASFAPFGAGDLLPLSHDGTQWGVSVDLQTQGLDTREGVSAVIRLDFGDGGTDDAVGSLLLNCDDPTAWTTTFAPLSADHQLDADAGTLDGVALTVFASLTDKSGDNATAELAFVVENTSAR